MANQAMHHECMLHAGNPHASIRASPYSACLTHLLLPVSPDGPKDKHLEPRPELVEG